MGAVRYFSHDRDAFSDPHIEDLRADYGMEGYGTYWAILESMCMEPDLSLPYTDKKAKMLQMKMGTSFGMKQFIDRCIECKLFVCDGRSFWSESLRARLASVIEISQKRSMAAKIRWEKALAGNEKETVVSQEASENKDYSLDIDSVDPEWRRVVESYETQLELLPTGKALDELMADYDAVGADAMIAAIEKTNLDRAGKPYPYLKAILKSFIDKGVHSKQQAEAEIMSFERVKNQSGARQTQEGPKNEEEVRWF